MWASWPSLDNTKPSRETVTQGILDGFARVPQVTKAGLARMQSDYRALMLQLRHLKYGNQLVEDYITARLVPDVSAWLQANAGLYSDTQLDSLKRGLSDTTTSICSGDKGEIIEELLQRAESLSKSDIQDLIKLLQRRV